MVRIGILDAHLPVGGELIRLLVNHPEIEIKFLHAPSLTGRNVVSVHHGLIGEQNLLFTDKADLNEIDLLIAPSQDEISPAIVSQLSFYPELKVITLNKNSFDNIEQALHTGLSEINRKALVRGANYAWILPTVIVPPLIALAPLAKYLLLNSSIDIHSKLPQDIIEANDLIELNKELSELLRQRQTSFDSEVSISTEISMNPRFQSTRISLVNSLPLDEIEKIYEETYDDHNFAFVSRNDISEDEVVGTQKVVLHLEKPQPDQLKIHIVSDPRMRGGAGDIVHILNLFFGLHEKTGLQLKSCTF